MTEREQVQIAEAAWQDYATEARKRARMEGDVHATPAQKREQQQRTDTAFKIFRTAFMALDPPTAAASVRCLEPAPARQPSSYVDRLLRWWRSL